MFDIDNKEGVAKYLAIPIAVFAVSTAAIFIRYSQSNPIAISFYRMLFSSIIFLFPALTRINELHKIKKNYLFYILISGVFLALHFSAWIASLEFTTVISSVVLVSSHPLLVMFISSRFLGESVNNKAYYSVFLALIGIFLIVYGDFSLNRWSVLGDLLAFIGMVFLALYLSIGRVVREEVSTVLYVFLAYSVASSVLAIFSLFVGTSFRIYQVSEYLIFIALAAIPTFFGHSIYNWALKHVRADFVSITLLGEPIISSILAFIILSEIPPFLTIIGSLIAIIGIYFSLIWR